MRRNKVKCFLAIRVFCPSVSSYCSAHRETHGLCFISVCHVNFSSVVFISSKTIVPVVQSHDRHRTHGVRIHAVSYSSHVALLCWLMSSLTPSQFWSQETSIREGIQMNEMRIEILWSMLFYIVSFSEITYSLSLKQTYFIFISSSCFVRPAFSWNNKDLILKSHIASIS